jgi:hypothetical protein
MTFYQCVVFGIIELFIYYDMVAFVSTTPIATTLSCLKDNVTKGCVWGQRH